MEQKKNVFEILNECLNKRKQTLTEAMENEITSTRFLYCLQSEYFFDFRDTSVNLFLFAKDRNAVVWLVNAGADINNGQETGITALSYAVYDRDEELIYSFLDNGAKPNKKFLQEVCRLYSLEFINRILPFFERDHLQYLFSIRKRFPKNIRDFLSSLEIN